MSYKGHMDGWHGDEPEIEAQSTRYNLLAKSDGEYYAPSDNLSGSGVVPCGKDEWSNTTWVNGRETYDGGSDKWPGTEVLPKKTMDGILESLGCKPSKHKIKTESFIDRVVRWFK